MMGYKVHQGNGSICGYESCREGSAKREQEGYRSACGYESCREGSVKIEKEGYRSIGVYESCREGSAKRGERSLCQATREKQDAVQGHCSGSIWVGLSSQ